MYANLRPRFRNSVFMRPLPNGRTAASTTPESTPVAAPNVLADATEYGETGLILFNVDYLVVTDHIVLATHTKVTQQRLTCSYDILDTI